MSVLADLSADLAKTVEAVGPSVVRIEARRRLPASGILWGDDVIVTASHVVQREENITVGLADGSTAGAALVGRDPATDVAVLRGPASGRTPAERAGADGLRVGHLVLALARPGRTVRATLGIVSALGESWRTPEGSEVDRYLQTDAPLHPGFSGGPLVDGAGRILGLNTAGVLRGVSLTIPVATLQRVTESLLTHGRVRRGYLGIGAQPVPLRGLAAPTTGAPVGLLLISIEPGSPAERAGLFVGDILVSFDGQPVGGVDALMALLGAERIGRPVPVRLVRGGQTQDITVEVGER